MTDCGAEEVAAVECWHGFVWIGLVHGMADLVSGANCKYTSCKSGYDLDRYHNSVQVDHNN